MDGNIMVKAGDITKQEQNNHSVITISEKELLFEILSENKKRTFYARIAAIAATAALAAVILCLLIFLPRVNSLVGSAQESLVSAQETLLEIENAAVGLSAMSENIVITSNELNTFITKNSDLLSQTVENMAEIDYEILNNAIKDLRDAVEPFARLVNKFK